MAQYSFRLLNEPDLAVFSQYLLPQVVQAIRQQELPWIVVGAIWKQFACGAAALCCYGKKARLASLFIDPQVREQGIGRQLLKTASTLAAEQGCKELVVRYLLSGEELTAMERLLSRHGKMIPENNPFVYGMDSIRYREHPLLKGCLHPGFRPSPSILPFDNLSPGQLEALEARKDIPSFLLPSHCNNKMDPALSVAWTVKGKITGYLLGGETGFRDFSLIAAWQAEVSTVFLQLLRAQLNLCFYRCGGDFRYFVSPVNAHAEHLLQQLTGGQYTRYEEHAAVLLLENFL